MESKIKKFIILCSIAIVLTLGYNSFYSSQSLKEKKLKNLQEALMHMVDKVDSNQQNGSSNFLNSSSHPNVSFQNTTNKKIKMFSIISISVMHKARFFYILYLPVVSLAWRKLGYEPLILIVKNGTTPFHDIANKTIEYLNELKIKVIIVDTPLNYEDHVGMLARCFGGLLPPDIVQDNDFIMTCDSDIVPVNQNYFTFNNTVQNLTEDIYVLNGVGIGVVGHEGKQYGMFPM